MKEKLSMFQIEFCNFYFFGWSPNGIMLRGSGEELKKFKGK